MLEQWRSFDVVTIAGMPIVTASRDQLADAARADCLAARAAPGGGTRMVFDANGHGIALFDSDPQFRDLYRHADVIHADGGFLVTLSRFAKRRIIERSATTDMLHDFAHMAQANGLSFYLLGGTEEVNGQCVEIMRHTYPDLIIAGHRNGYFAAEDEPAIVAAINASAADILWVGLGKPQEQQFCVRHKERLRPAWSITCGGCYNYVTGAYARAPKWMQKANIEWLHRMVTEPRKLAWRYLTTNPRALWATLKRSGRQSPID